MKIIYWAIMSTMLANVNLAFCAKSVMYETRVKSSDFNTTIAKKCEEISSDLKTKANLSKTDKIAKFFQKNKKEASKKDIDEIRGRIINEVLQPIAHYYKKFGGYVVNEEIKRLAVIDAQEMLKALNALNHALSKSAKKTLGNSVYLAWQNLATITGFKYDKNFVYTNADEFERIDKILRDKGRKSGENEIKAKTAAVEKNWNELYAKLAELNSVKKISKERIKELDSFVTNYVESVYDTIEIRGRRQLTAIQLKAFLSAYKLILKMAGIK